MLYDKYTELCKSIGKTPSAVAIELGFNKGSVSVWKKKAISGENFEPSVAILSKIADYFNCSVDYLLDRSDNHFILSNHEKTVITAYRSQPQMQTAVDRILGIINNSKSDTPPAELKIAAYGGDNIVKHAPEKPKIT